MNWISAWLIDFSIEGERRNILSRAACRVGFETTPPNRRGLTTFLYALVTADVPEVWPVPLKWTPKPKVFFLNVDRGNEIEVETVPPGGTTRFMFVAGKN